MNATRISSVFELLSPTLLPLINVCLDETVRPIDNWLGNTHMDVFVAAAAAVVAI